MNWHIIDTGKNSAQKNMLIDAELLHSLKEDALLHLYDWDKDSATYGYFIRPPDFFNFNYVENIGLDLARRPTGGGIVFHVADYAFSVLVPKTHRCFSLNPLENYYFINSLVGKVIYEFSGKHVDLLPFENKEVKGDFCMAKPTKYDIMLEGKKVGGAAQRKTKEGFLHQGSIFLGHLKEEFLLKILKDPLIVSLMFQKSTTLLDSQWTVDELQAMRQGLKKTFIKVFS